MKVNASLKRISTNFDVDLPHFQPPTNHPPSISTYFIFNQLRIIYPQFGLKGKASRNAKFRVESPLALQMQQPPRGGTWVGSTCDISKSYEMQILPSKWLQDISKIF
ncbi:hypothetical protein V1478_016412 [Vespula squamosa]|uniref:Uncharacterized protein n=1 Tax=Vespula squamosa TaxID=30214 RepID=A0ABD2A2D2_VESSQ